MAVIKRVISNTWDFSVAVVAAVAAAKWMTAGVIESITTEVIAFFTIQAAVILPAMIFTAGILKGDALTVTEVKRFQVALRRQMVFWVTLLALDLSAVVALITGKAANWTWKVTIVHGVHWTGQLSWLLFAVAAFTGVLAILRMVPFVSAVVSLLELNGWLALKAAEARAKQAAKIGEAVEPVSPFDLPEDYGRVLPPTEH